MAGHRAAGPAGEARDAALRLLGRRPRTELELRQALAARGQSAAAIDQVVEELREAGYVDDLALALDYIVTRVERLAHGGARLRAELERRGVSSAVAEQAWQRAVEREGVAPELVLRRQITRRLEGRARLDARGYARMYNALLRAGFDDEAVRRELESYRAHPGVDPQGLDDEFP